MKAILFSLLLAFPAFADMGVEVTNIRDPMLPCDCSKPERVGNVCVVPTIFAHPELESPHYHLEHPTRFEPRVEEVMRPDGSELYFVFKSVTYYGKCGFDIIDITYKDENLNYQYKQAKTLWAFAFKGQTPTMRVAVFNQQGVGQYGPEQRGTFGEEVNTYRAGKYDELTRTDYPGTVEYRTQLYKLLTDSQIRRILDDSVDQNRVVKVWLSVYSNQGSNNFGEYTVKLRFFRKPGPLRTHWDLNAIGIEMVN